MPYYLLTQRLEIRPHTAWKGILFLKLVLLSYLLQLVFKNWIQSEGKTILNIPPAMIRELT